MTSPRARNIRRAAGMSVSIAVLSCGFLATPAAADELTSDAETSISNEATVDASNDDASSTESTDNTTISNEATVDYTDPTTGESETTTSNEVTTNVDYSESENFSYDDVHSSDDTSRDASTESTESADTTISNEATVEFTDPSTGESETVTSDPVTTEVNSSSTDEQASDQSTSSGENTVVSNEASVEYTDPTTGETVTEESDPVNTVVLNPENPDNWTDIIDNQAMVDYTDPTTGETVTEESNTVTTPVIDPEELHFMADGTSIGDDMLASRSIPNVVSDVNPVTPKVSYAYNEQGQRVKVKVFRNDDGSAHYVKINLVTGEVLTTDTNNKVLSRGSAPWAITGDVAPARTPLGSGPNEVNPMGQVIKVTHFADGHGGVNTMRVNTETHSWEVLDQNGNVIAGKQAKTGSGRVFSVSGELTPGIGIKGALTVDPGTGRFAYQVGPSVGWSEGIEFAYGPGTVPTHPVFGASVKAALNYKYGPGGVKIGPEATTNDPLSDTLGKTKAQVNFIGVVGNKEFGPKWANTWENGDFSERANQLYGSYKVATKNVPMTKPTWGEKGGFAGSVFMTAPAESTPVSSNNWGPGPGLMFTPDMIESWRQMLDGKPAPVPTRRMTP